MKYHEITFKFSQKKGGEGGICQFCCKDALFLYEKFMIILHVVLVRNHIIYIYTTCMYFLSSFNSDGILIVFSVGKSKKKKIGVKSKKGWKKGESKIYDENEWVCIDLFIFFIVIYFF